MLFDGNDTSSSPCGAPSRGFHHHQPLSTVLLACARYHRLSLTNPSGTRRSRCHPSNMHEQRDRNQQRLHQREREQSHDRAARAREAPGTAPSGASMVGERSLARALMVIKTGMDARPFESGVGQRNRRGHELRHRVLTRCGTGCATGLPRHPGETPRSAADVLP